jgi:hypothetical protein
MAPSHLVKQNADEPSRVSLLTSRPCLQVCVSSGPCKGQEFHDPTKVIKILMPVARESG